jgi:alpha-ketoglutaric semialdehyde dehydrogenase
MSEYHNLIGGVWTAGDPVENRNPSDTRDVIGAYHHASTEDVANAIGAAREAFSAWSRSGVQTRLELLDRIGAEILSRSDELADLLAREEGKTKREALGEVTRAGNIFRFFAGECVRTNGDLLPSVRPGAEVMVTREPIGVVSVIAPWNFPIAIPAWKIAPALAYGNCVVFKPAELTPGSAWALAEIIHRAGVPAGVFNLVMGRGSLLGAAMLQDVDAVSFTGSTSVGHQIRRNGTEKGLKVQLEMGGKNALVVLADADIDVAVQCALDGAFFATGQRCTASSRLIVEDAIHDRFVAALRTAMQSQVVGDARDPATTIGPVVDERQLATDTDYIDIALADGAKLAEGGQLADEGKHGHFLKPALFVDTTPDMRINREEVFGPVASVIRVAGYEEALSVANDVDFGLCAGICTTSLAKAAHFRRGAEVGMVMVNLPTAGVDYHVPFGGRKASSHGPREQGRYAADFYTTVKTAYVAAGEL